MSQKLRKNYISCPKCRKQRHINTKEKGLVSVHCSCGEQLYPFKNATPTQTTAQLPGIKERFEMFFNTLNDQEKELFNDYIVCRLSTQHTECEQTSPGVESFFKESRDLKEEQLIAKAWQRSRNIARAACKEECEQKVAEAVKAERERIASGLDNLQTHGLDINIHLDEASYLTEYEKRFNSTQPVAKRE